jgi:MoxR-like ATPase
VGQGGDGHRLHVVGQDEPAVVTGASPRASLSLLDVAKARAAIDGRRFVLPDDVKAVAVPALAHRLVLSGGPDMAAGAAAVRAVLGTVPVPPTPTR